MRRIQSQPIYPFLLAVYPVLHLYAANAGLLFWIWTVLPIILSLAGTLTIFGIAKLILKDSLRAGLLASVIVLVFFLYGHAVLLLDQALFLMNLRDRVPGTNRYVLAVSLVVITGTFCAVIKHGRKWKAILPILNGLALILLMMPVVSVFVYRLGSLNRLQVGTIYDDVPIGHSIVQPLPAIYYVVLDGYARKDVLRDYYGYDNSGFVKDLTRRGFYVVPEARANYATTPISLASSLNMEYLDDLASKVGKRSSDRTPLYAMIQNNRVARTLKRSGYTIVQFPSGYGPTSFNQHADLNYAPHHFLLANEFTIKLLTTTLLKLVLPDCIVLDPFGTRRGILYNLVKASEIPQIEGPSFVFLHLIIPHPPFVFDQHGDFPPRGVNEGNPWLNRPAYVEQVMFLNKMIIQLVDALIARSKTPPVIILQSDHGPESLAGWDNPTSEFIYERMSNFNAYYVSQTVQRRLYPTITPVNSFRLIFDYYLGTSLGLLEDRSYFSNWRTPYDFALVSSFEEKKYR